MRAARTATASALFLVAVVSLGCAGYAGSVADMRHSLLRGDKPGALKHVNHALDVDQSDEYPKKLKGDNALLLLERAMVQQGQGQLKASAADFRVADKHLELLDLKNDTMGNIGKYIFSDDATVYKAPAYEKLLLNTFNLLNYLSLGDIEGARVEARRLRVMQKYLSDEGSRQTELLGLGHYLAGFAFEMSGQNEQALDYYSDALANYKYPSLLAPLSRLKACTGYKSETVDAFLNASGAQPTASCTEKPKDTGTVLVVSGVGLVPYKVAKRFPIGPALVLAGVFLGAGQTEQAQRLMARGLLTWINFPVLQRTPLGFSTARTYIDGAETDTEVGADVTEKVIAAWDSIKGKLMAAAITRMITRLVAGIATEKAVEQASGNAIGGLLAGLAVQGALTVADTPDTRSWVTLPSRVMFSRTEVPAGRHEITVVFEGAAGRYQEKRVVDVKAGGFIVVPVSTMR